jgi:hypothetical protein
VNNALAERVIRVLEEHPELHNQRMWVSRSVNAAELRKMLDQPRAGLTACTAGWICAFTLPDRSILDVTGHLYRSRFHLGHISSISQWARDALEISSANANWLFSETRTRQDVIDGLRWLQTHPNAILACRDWEIKPPTIARDKNRLFLDLATLRNFVGLRSEDYLENRPRQPVG